jgi:hypothetical protein
MGGNCALGLFFLCTLHCKPRPYGNLWGKVGIKMLIV